MDKDMLQKTTCCYCGVGCGLVVKKSAEGKLLSAGDPDHPVNRGMLCSKGINLHYTATDLSDRILHPMLRADPTGPLKRVSWEEAIGEAATRLRAITREHGPDSVGFYVSGQCLTEEYYLVNKIAKGFIGTNNIDTNSRLCMSSAVSAYKMALGEDSVPGCYDDIELADTFLIAGANPAWCHPILYRRIEAHKAANPQVRVIVVDPRRTQTAARADLHLQITPGTDVVLFHAIARGLIENGFIDEAFIRDHTEGFSELKEVVMRRSLQEAAAICGVRFTDIYRAIKSIGYSGGFISMWAMGLNQSTIGVSKNLALINLSLITGKIGKPGCGPFSLTGQANAMGGREVGGMATLAPAHRELSNPAHLREVADYWGVPSVPSRPGLTATEMFQSLRDGRMKAIWIICTNPAVTMPDAHLVDQALQAAELVIVQDMSWKADTLAHADLVLPAATWLEKEGTMTNSERRVSHLSRVLTPPGEALADVEILLKFAAKMGWGNHFNYPGLRDVYDEHAGLSRGTRVDVSGLDYDRLHQGTFQWPVPEKSAPGTPRLFSDQVFYRPGGLARIVAVEEENHAEPLTADYPLILTTGRIRDQWHTMTRTGKVYNLSRHIPAPFMEIHPGDAAARGICSGDPVDITSPRGEVRVNAVVTDTIKNGVVFLPMHWGKIVQRSAARANNLTSMRVDPVSRQPGFKYSSVQVSRYRKAVEKILIWGEGEEVLSFIRKYRTFNLQDELVWLCGEDPVYTSMETWQRYLFSGNGTPAMESGWLESFQVQLIRRDNSGELDRDKKVVRTSDGVYGYDKLILAGVYPREEKPAPGVYRIPGTRATADKLKGRLTPGSIWILDGADPSVISLAAAIAEREMEVHLAVPRESVLGSLVDPTAVRLITRLLSRSGIQVHPHSLVEAVNPCGERWEAVFSTGETLLCDGVITCREPVMPGYGNAGGPGQSGPTHRVAINGYMETAHPGVFAIGRLTRLDRGDVPGSGLAQAQCLADYLRGNLLNPYRDTPPALRFQIAGKPLGIVGDIRMGAEGGGYEEIILLDEQRYYYKKCVILNDRLVGALLLGDVTEYAAYSELISAGTELGENRETLLRPGAAQSGAAGKVICSCRGVGEGTVLEAIHAGCRTVEEIGEKTGAGTRCGSCRPELASLLMQNK